MEDYRESFPLVTPIVFDGCALPFADKSFDIVYSNAVEHLPGWGAVERFANEVQRVGRSWFISTPCGIPSSPTITCPLCSFYRRKNRNSSGPVGKPTYDHLQLLSKRDLRRMFPTSAVVGCRVTFYPETLMAYRAPEGA